MYDFIVLSNLLIPAAIAIVYLLKLIPLVNNSAAFASAAKPFSRVMTIIFAILGVVAVLSLGTQVEEFWLKLKSFFHMSFLDSIFLTSAYAADNTKISINDMAPYIVAGVLSLMAISFIIALFVVVLTKRTTETASGIDAADSIVKTFGGFFSGIVLALLGIK